MAGMLAPCARRAPTGLRSAAIRAVARDPAHVARHDRMHPAARGRGWSLIDRVTANRVPDVSPTEPTPTTASDAAIGSRARTCAGCGSVNHAGRLLCAACGVDLDDPTTPVTVGPQPRRADRVWSGVPDGARLGRRWALAVFAIGAVVAVVLGVLVVVEVGPFARAADIPEASFDAAAYPQEPQRLVLSDVAALTTRATEDGRAFTPRELVDGDPASSWHGELADLPDGLVEKVDLVLDRPAWVTAVIIDNGDQASPDDYAAAGRVQRGQLVFDGAVVLPVTLLDQGLEPQIVELDEPLLTTAIRLEILETVPGTERDGPALSGVALRGHPADGDDLDVADERASIRPAAGPIVEPG